MEILILHPGALGDIILSFPAIDLLRDRFAPARVTLAGNLDYLTATARGHADRALSLSRLPLHALYVSEPLPTDQVRFWQSFDMILSWTGSNNAGFVQTLRATHPNAHVAAWKPPPGKATHVSRMFVQSLYPWIEVPDEIPPAKIILDAETTKNARDWFRAQAWAEGESVVALHPGAGSEEKRWSLNCYKELAQLLTESSGVKVLIIEGPAEPGLGTELAQGLPLKSYAVVRQVSLTALAGILELCAAFVGNDSGIAHMAAALRRRTLVLFGPTFPELWAPLGEKVVVLRNAEDCAVCCSTPDATMHTCMNGLSVSSVWKQLCEWGLGNQNPPA